MTKLTTLPPEIRNEIYKLLLTKTEPIHITSPLKKHQRKKHISVLSVNKQINAEAATFFYSLNTFVIGNGQWGSTTQVNLHGFKSFTSRVPKNCMAMIRNIELDIFSPEAGGRYCIRGEDVSQVRSVCHRILKHLKGLESVTIAARDLYRWDNKDRGRFCPWADLSGDFENWAKTVQKLLSLPTLKQLSFRIQSARNMNLFADAVLEGKKEARDVVIMMVNEDGRFVLF